MRSVGLVSVDGLRLDSVVHPATATEVGTVVQVHGITVDMDEGGMFVRLAESLAARGLTVLRFSFRGPGASGGTQEGVTIAGEMLDLQAAVELVRRDYPAPLSVVAASFGVVSCALSLPYLEDLRSLALWNPVLDLQRTFLEPELPWGVENFGPEQLEEMRRTGSLLVDDEFRLGRVLFEEMALYRPDLAFAASSVPALVIHGDRDSAVSYDIAKAAATARESCDFHTVEGSDHGFDTREREDEAIAVTVEWLGRKHSAA